MCDCFHIAFPNWHAANSGTGANRRLRAPEPGTEDDSICEEPSQFNEGERPRPQGSSPVEEFPEKYTDSDKECEAEHDHKRRSRKKSKKSGIGSMFEKRSTPKMSKLKELPSPESGVIVKTAQDGCSEGLVYSGGGKDGIFIKAVVPESPASKSLKLKEGDQLLSATVYFDNVSYEDAIQILEHAQAYKVKLCLKRNPEITETEPAIDSDVIHQEEDIFVPEMREQGKTKRRSEARISWPKFPSFGKGKKSRFARSHSSSEADEQRKLELSPTTSDTESPLKSLDAPKGKKKHKIKLSGLKKRGRISSSEDQETDTTGNILQTHEESDNLSPECLESLTGQTPEDYMTEHVKIADDLRHEQNDLTLTEAQAVQHKADLITIDNTLKTADLTVALADKESPAGIKSPDGKKKKKERSELKFKLCGRDKSSKKDAKAKSSPKRLKTLGASIEKADQPENEKSDEILSIEPHAELQGGQLALDAKTQVTTQMEMSAPKVELEMHDEVLVEKSQKKGEEKIKKDGKQKTGSKFKLPKIDMSEILTQETILMDASVEECTADIEPFTTDDEVKEDPYERLSKGSLTRTKLPKREDIVIPGMEDMSMITTTKGFKEPKPVFTGHHDEIRADNVAMSIDVDSVKEAVSKLPGFKLPKVDMSGMPIPEEITVLDANAQRISVKTPTKVIDTKTKHEAPHATFDTSASPEISKTTFKLPKIPLADLPSREILMETKVDLKTPEKKYKKSQKEIKTEVYKREDIIIPGLESAQEVDGITSKYESAAQITLKDSEKKSRKVKMTTASFGVAKPDIKIPNIGFDFQISKEKDDTVKGERTIFLQETSQTQTIKEGQIGGAISDVKIANIDGIEYIDSVGGSPAKKDSEITLTSFGFNLDAARPNADSSFTENKHGVKDVEGGTIKLQEADAVFGLPQVEKPEKEIKSLQTDIELDGQGSKFKMPKVGIKMPKLKGPEFDISLSKKDQDSSLPKAKAEIKLPQAQETDVSFGGADFCIPQQKIEIEKPEMEIKPLHTEAELDGQGGKFKMPHLGFSMPKVKGPKIDLSLSKKDMDVTLPEAKAEVELPQAPEMDVSVRGADVSIPQKKIQIAQPELEIELLQTEGELDGQGGKFKMPHLGFSMPKVKGPKIDLSLSKKDVDVTLPEAKAEVKLSQAPDMDVSVGGTDFSIPQQKIEMEKPGLGIKPPHTEADLDGQGGKFKMPHLGFSMPKVKGPKIDLSLSKKNVDFTLPEAKAEVELPEVDIGKVNVSITDAKMEVEKPELEMQSLQTEGEFDGQGGKFKMQKLGIKMPKLKGPEIDMSLSKKDVDVTLPQTKVEVNLPDYPKIDVNLEKADVLIPKAEAEVEKPELEIGGQGGKFKMPKLGMSMPKVKGPEFHLGASKKDVDVTLPEAKAEIELPEAPKIDVDIKPPECVSEIDSQASKFKVPKFGVKMPKVKGPEIDLDFSKKDVDMTLPESKAEVKLPDFELETPSAEMEIKAPEIKIATKDTEESPSKFKRPSFKLPKFGIIMPSATVEMPDMKKDVKIDGADVTIPEVVAPSIETEGPSIDIKTTGSEHEGKGSKFKMPKFGITTGPEIDLSLSKKDVDVTLPKAKAEVNLPELELEEYSAEVKVKSPEIKVTTKDKEGSPSKFKMPTFKFPKFGSATANISGEVPETDHEIYTDGADLHISVPQTDVDIPKIKADVHLPEVDVKGPSSDVVIDEQPSVEIDAKVKKTRFSMPRFSFSKQGGKTPEVDVSLQDVDVVMPEASVEVKPLDGEAEIEGKESALKLRKFGMSTPKVTGPEIDLSLSKKDVDVTLQKAEFKLPDVELEEPSAEVKIKSPEIKVTTKDTEESPSKFKMPSFKIPKFGIRMPSATMEMPDTSRDIKIDGSAIEIPEEVLTVEVVPPSIETEAPSIDIKTTGHELEGKGGKFKMPKFGITMPKVSGPEFDLNSSKKDVDVTLPEGKAEVKLPEVELKETSAEMEIKAPEIKVATKDKETSPSKFKMPSFRLPKFGVGMPSATVEMPDTERDVKIDGTDITIPEELLTVEVVAPSIETEGPSIDIKTTGTELEGKGSKFKMPKFGVSMPKVSGPEIDFGLSKKDVDVTLPAGKVEVKLPDVELKEPSVEMEIKAPEIKGDAKLKKRFSLPKFSFSKQSSQESGVEISLPDVDVTLPEANVEVKQTEVEFKAPEGDVELDGQESKFKMPKFGMSMPKVKSPDIDLSISKKDVDVTIPEVEIKEPSAEMEIKTPEIKVATKDRETSPSKFKMPSFKLPKFGIGMPSASAEMPHTNKDLKIEGADITIPEEVLTVEVVAPRIETEGPSIDIKTTGTELEGKGSKFEMPKFGISMPKVSGPEIDLSFSKKDVDVTLPEGKVEVKLPDVEVKEPEIAVSGPDAPTVEVEAQSKRPSWAFPRFSFSKAGGKAPDVDVNLEKPKVDVTLPEAEAEVCLPDVSLPEGNLEVKEHDLGLKQPEVDIEIDGQESKFKMPKFGLSMPKVKGPEIDSSSSKKDVDVTLPESKAEVQLPDVKMEVKGTEIEIKSGNVKGSPSKFKMPTFTLPKFGAATPKVSVEVPDVEKDIKVDGAKLDVTQEGAVDITAPSIDTEGPSVDVKAKGSEHEGSGGKFKMPKFGISMPKVSGPEIDMSLSKKDVDVTLPEGKVEVKMPDVEVKESEIAISGPVAPTVEIEAQSKRPSWAFPRFSFSKAGGKAPDVDVNLETPKVDVTLPEAEAEVCLSEVEVQGTPGGIPVEEPPAVELDANLKKTKFSMPRFSFSKSSAKEPVVSAELPHLDVSIPEGNVEVQQPEVEFNAPEGDMVIDGQESKFKMPKFGISMPKVSGPEIDLSSSKKDVDVTLPEAKAEVQLPDVKMEVKAPEIEVQSGNVKGSPSKFKMPTFTLPKFGAATPKVSVEVPDVEKDIKVDGAKLEVTQGGAVDITAPSIDTDGPSVDVKAKGSEHEGSGGKFKMPKFGVSMPKVKGPEIDFSISKKDVDVTLPEVKAEVKLPDAAVKEPEIAISGPDAPTVEVEAQSKRPSWAFPRFSFSKAGGKAPDVDVNLETPKVDVSLPEAEAEVCLPEVDVQGTPGAISMEEPPAVELDANLKKTKFSMPRFSFSKSSAKEPVVSAELPHLDVSIPEGNVEVKQPEVGVKAPEGDVEIDGQESKFKMPKFGLSMPKVSGPEFDLSLSRKDVDFTVPEGKAEVKLPEFETSAEMEIKAPEIGTKDTEESPSKFKRPSFKLPKFGIIMPSATVEMPDTNKDLKIDGKDITIPEELLTVEVVEPSIETEGPSIDIKTTGTELEGKGSKFEMPKFGLSMPKVSGPEFDLSLSRKDVDFTIPEGKAEVKLPEFETSAEMEIKAPEIKIGTKDTEESPSKFKRPSFKLPKFGIIMPSATVEMPDTNKDLKMDGKDITIPEEVLTVEVVAPSIETEGPSIDIKTTGTELEGKGSKFKMPKFGISMPKVSGPEIDMSLSKKDVDVTLPEGKVEVKLPDVEVKEPEIAISVPDAPTVEVEAKSKRPSWAFPRFSFSKAGGKTPDVDVNVETPKVDVTLPEAEAEVCLPDVSLSEGNLEVKEHDLGLKQPEGDIEIDGQESKFKMPKFGLSMPKVKGPEFDLSLSKKEVDVTLPEAKAEVQLPDVKMEVIAPEIEVQSGNVKGSPSKFKMPTFTLPKFGAATPKVSVEVTDVEKDIKVDGAKLDVTQEGAVDITAPSIDTDGPSVDVKAKGSEHEGSGGKLKMPKFGVSMPKVKGPEIDFSISKKDVDVTLPEVKAEVKLPDVEVKEPEIAISGPDAPTVEVEAQSKRPSWAFPRFSFSKAGGKAPDVDVNLETPKVDVTLPETEAEVCLPEVDVQGTPGAISMEEPPAVELDANLKKTKISMPRFSFSKSSAKEPEVSAELPHLDVSIPEGNVEVKQPEVGVKAPEGDVELDGQESKFKMPKFGFSMPKVTGPEFDLSLSKKDVDVTLPKAKAEVQLPDVKMEVKAPEIEVQSGNVKGSPSKFKMPTFTLPKFGAATPKVSVEVPDVEKDIKVDGTKLDVTQEGAVDITTPSIDTEGPSVDVKAKGSEHEGSGGKFKMPKFGISMPKVKGPEFDLSLSKKDVDVTLPEGKAEVKLPEVELKETSAEMEIKAPEIKVATKDTEGSPSKFKMPSFKLPKFGVGMPSAAVEMPDTNKDIKIDGTDITIPEEVLKVEVVAPKIETEGPSIDIKTTGSEHEGKGSKFKMPKFGVSMPKVSGPEIDMSLSKKDVDVTLPEGKVEVKLPDVEVKESEIAISVPDAPTIEVEAKSKRPSWAFPRFSFSKAGGKAPDVDVNLETPKVDVSLPEAEAEVCLPEDVGITQPEVKGEVKLHEVEVKSSAGLEMKAFETDSETPKGSADLGSPSKFKLPSFLMPKMSFSSTKPEVEYAPVETECQEGQLDVEVESKEESKSPKMSLPSFGEMLKSFDVEFDVSPIDKSEKSLESSKDVHELDAPSEKQLEEKEIQIKKDAVKSPEKTSWFKFPRFGLSSPSEPAKTPEKEKVEKSPVEEEISSTCSVQSSDAFADVSSAMTSEHVGMSLSSPTRVTVKYSDPNASLGLGEMHSNIITSTTRTEMISVEPNLPEKITILSSGFSSSSEDTVRLDSGKIHVITSNIQATPEAQQATLFTAVQVQPAAGGLALKSEANEAASWTVEDSQSGKRSVFERHVVTETSSERSESKETIVITKQITRVFDSSEPVLGDTATSIQRLKDSMHSDKMKFFDGDEE